MYHLKTMYYWSLNSFHSSLKILHFHMKGTVEKYNQIIAQMNIRKKYKMPIWPVANQLVRLMQKKKRLNHIHLYEHMAQ